MRLLRATVNLFLLVTLPLWLGTYAIIVILKDRDWPIEELKGSKWLFE